VGADGSLEVAGVRIEAVEAPATFALRQSVLRPHQSVAEIALADDDAPETLTLAGLDAASEVVATGRVALAPLPDVLGDVAVPVGRIWQLRAMATRPDRQREGIGSAVLTRVFDHIASSGGGLLWCNARVAAVGLYRRAGLVEVGEVFSEPHIGPHIVMWREIGPA
jgi:ribosomal protein S18 acetylase RimI-like enzyme